MDGLVGRWRVASLRFGLWLNLARLGKTRAVCIFNGRAMGKRLDFSPTSSKVDKVITFFKKLGQLCRTYWTDQSGLRADIRPKENGAKEV